MAKKKTTSPEKQKLKYSKLIVLFVIAINIIYAAVVLYIFSKNGEEPGILTGSWFAFTTGELMSLAMIKKNEL